MDPLQWTQWEECFWWYVGFWGFFWLLKNTYGSGFTFFKNFFSKMSIPLQDTRNFETLWQMFFNCIVALSKSHFSEPFLLSCINILKFYFQSNSSTVSKVNSWLNKITKITIALLHLSLPLILLPIPKVTISSFSSSIYFILSNICTISLSISDIMFYGR